MLRRALRWLTGRSADDRTAPDRPTTGGRAPQAPSSALPVAVPTRAMRDAAVVTAAIEAMRRFADGTETPEALVHRLGALGPEQAGFLQISVDAALVSECNARADGLRGPVGAELARLLAELAADTPPRRTPATAMNGPVYGPRSVFGPLAESAPQPDAPVPDDFQPLPVPVPQTLGHELPPMPTPAPPPKVTAPGFPRLRRAAAEARRARLSDTLSNALPTTPPHRGEDAHDR